MSNQKNYGIYEIEALTEDQARDMALETLTIKDHTVYLVDFGGAFGYSRLVFCNGHHIHYANDYQLHHRSIETQAALRQTLIDGANSILFTEEELAEPLKTYDEFKRKEHFLRNYYHMREDYVSMFGNFNDLDYTEKYRKKTADMIPDQLSFCFFPADRKAFVKHHYALASALYKREAELKDSYEYQKSAFLSEMFNHEYGINWQADYDVLSSFGNIEYHDDDDAVIVYFDALKFTETQRRAYYDARQEYFRTAQF